MKNKVFLSYSYKDKDWVNQFAHSLEKLKIDIWFDTKEIDLGDNISNMLQEALRSSNILIVILSSHSVKSPWIYFELGAAVADNKRIIPVVIDEIGQENLPLSITKYQYLREVSPVKAGEKVAQALGKLRNDFE